MPTLPITYYLNNEGTRTIVQDLGHNLENVTDPTKWAVVAVLALEAAAVVAMGEDCDSLIGDTIEIVLQSVELTDSEIKDLKFIVGQCTDFSETEQAQFIQAVAVQLEWTS